MDISRLDYLHCKAILQQGSKSFRMASLLLPPRVRIPVTALYAFCRRADDAVDEPGAKRQALDAMQARLDRVYAFRALDDPLERAFATTIASYHIPREIPEAMLEGFAWDLQLRRYDQLSDVLRYAARVASSVGVMMTLVMGERRAWALARASELGAAMQLTNIARDVGDDARQGRLYLPLLWLHEAGISDVESWLRNPVFSPPLAAVIRRLLDEADVLYARAETGIDVLPQDCQASIRSASFIYADIGRDLRAHGYDSITRRAHTSAPRKAKLISEAYWGGWRRRRNPGPRDEIRALDETNFLIRAVVASDLRRIGHRISPGTALCPGLQA